MTDLQRTGPAPFPLDPPAPAHSIAVMLGIADLDELSAAEILECAGQRMNGDGCMVYGDTRDTAQHDNTRRAYKALVATVAYDQACSEPTNGTGEPIETRPTRGIGEPIETTIGDLLSDLMHLCDAAGLPFMQVINRAAGEYQTELVGH